MTKAAVLGSGSWGTAFAKVLAEAGTDVTMWARRAELAEAISDRHENPDYLPGISLPPTISATSDPERALADADIVVLAVPSQSLRANLIEWTEFIPRDATLLSLAKGIETGTLLRMSQVPTPVGSHRCPGRTSRVRSPRVSRRRPSSPARIPGAHSRFKRVVLQDTFGRIPTPTSSVVRSVAPARM